MKDKITASNLSDNRLVKRTFAKIVFNNSDMLTKLVGLNQGEIEKHEMDLENDITAIFYYYGYIGTPFDDCMEYIMDCYITEINNDVLQGKLRSEICKLPYIAREDYFVGNPFQVDE